MFLIATDETVVLCAVSYRPEQVARYTALWVNVLSTGKLVSSQMIYLTFCYLAILVSLHVCWMS